MELQLTFIYSSPLLHHLFAVSSPLLRRLGVVQGFGPSPEEEACICAPPGNGPGTFDCLQILDDEEGVERILRGSVVQLRSA